MKAHPKGLWLAVTMTAFFPVAASAQMPSRFEEVELERSRDCVPVLARLDELDRRLAPLADRSQRLIVIAEAIALEERAVVDSLRASDPVEAQVRAWFQADEALAERYVASPTQALLEERTAARDQIKLVVSEALEAIDAEASTVVESTGSLRTEAGSCSGASFIRPAVLEACAAASSPSPVCAAARDSTTTNGPFRFVESAEVLWGLSEMRAWSAPGPLQVSPTGQLGGARTIGLTRTGNVVVNLALRPRFRRRADLTPAETDRMRILTDSLGFGDEHPQVVFVPVLQFQASLPAALDGETLYVFHFGEPEDADILWTAPAGTGAPVEGIVELGPGRLTQLSAGEPLLLTAIRPNEEGANDPVFAIDLTSINQGNAVQTLLGYMASRLPRDLAAVVPPEPS